MLLQLKIEEFDNKEKEDWNIFIKFNKISWLSSIHSVWYIFM